MLAQGGQKMALLVKCLPCKPEDLSSTLPFLSLLPDHQDVSSLASSWDPFHNRPQTSSTKWPSTKTSETVSQDEPVVPLSELAVSSISYSAGKLTSVCDTVDAESATALYPRTNLNQPEKNV